MSLSAYDLLWLLLPVAAASGWIAARWPVGGFRKHKSFDLPSAYFKGLNYLLNEQPDKAIELFIKVLEVNAETAETHLALGNLFRRRGEVERAIRVHQNLVAKPTLDPGQRAQALLELGQDYLKAGLFDRAENLFNELIDNREYSERALEYLLSIYQQERDWDAAIEVSKKLAKASGESQKVRIAQYYCELAQIVLDKKDYSTAERHIKQAFNADQECVRASLIQGNIEAEQGNYSEAIKSWKKIEKQDASFLGDVADRIANAYRKLGDEAGLQEFFSSVSERHNSAEMMLVLGDIIKEKEGVETAEAFIIDWLRKKPSVQGLYRLIDLNVWKAGSQSSDLMLLKGIIGELKNRQEGYVCKQCGFKGKSMHWLCPSCSDWNTIRPEQDNQ